MHLSGQLSAVVCEVDCDPQGQAVPVLKSRHTIEGYLLTDDIDVRCVSCLRACCFPHHGCVVSEQASQYAAAFGC